jgi:hypothetical protein
MVTLNDTEARQVAGIIGGLNYTPKALDSLSITLEGLVSEWYKIGSCSNSLTRYSAGKSLQRLSKIPRAWMAHFRPRNGVEKVPPQSCSRPMAWRSRSRCRNSTRRILPLMVFGNSAVNSISRGYLYGAVTRFTCSWRSCSNCSEG